MRPKALTGNSKHFWNTCSDKSCVQGNSSRHHLSECACTMPLLSWQQDVWSRGSSSSHSQIYNTYTTTLHPLFSPSN